MSILLGETSFDEQVHLALQAVRAESGEIVLVSSEINLENMQLVVAKTILQIAGNGDEPNEFMGITVQFEEETYEDMVCRSVLAACRNAGVPTYYLDHTVDSFKSIPPRRRAMIALTIAAWQNGKPAPSFDRVPTSELIDQAIQIVEETGWSNWEEYEQPAG